MADHPQSPRGRERARALVVRASEALGALGLPGGAAADLCGLDLQAWAAGATSGAGTRCAFGRLRRVRECRQPLGPDGRCPCGKRGRRS